MYLVSKVKTSTESVNVNGKILISAQGPELRTEVEHFYSALLHYIIYLPRKYIGLIQRYRIGGDP